MGYYTEIRDSDAVLPASNLAEAYKRLCDLNQRDELKSGGSYSKGEQTQRWFAWMKADYPDHHSNAKSILEEVGYGVEELENGDLVVNYYSNKTGCEDTFIWAISDLFKAHSHMVWMGEDGDYYRWEFGGGDKMISQTGRLTWSESETFEPTNWQRFDEHIKSWLGQA
jgi:hypothetical protein